MKQDALDLLRTFIAHDVRFLIVGAHAVGYYAEPRATGDLDLFIDPTPENAHRAYVALAEFGAPLEDLTQTDLSTPGIVFQMGVPPYRIDVVTQLSGVSFEDCWRGHALSHLAGLDLPIIAYDALVANKRAIGRPKDLIDLQLLAKHSRRTE